ncbi:MAG: amidohydrolase [Candidatus Marinimicrobia bacterium]|nr:amidohydrolase [Candidatus Neomarinimicrobiota bacterium]
MIKLFSILFICVVAFGCARSEADKLFINAIIYTLNSANDTAGALAVRDGKILFIGSLDDAYEHTGDNTETIDLKGYTLIPGLTDAHAHVEGTGKFLQTLSFLGTGSAEEIAEIVRKAALRTPKGEWIEGRGWDQNDWEIKKFPASDLLDEAAPENPVVFSRVDGHAYWVNQTVLDLAGINSDTPDPDGGRIVRRPGSNEPSGILIDNAQTLVDDVKPEPSKELKKKRIIQALSHALKLGITTLHDPGSDSDNIDIYMELGAEGRLNPRIYAMLDDDDELKEKYYDIGPQIGLFDNHLNIRTLKFYADGALGSRGALLLEPYSDEPGNRGLRLTPETELRSSFRKGIDHGFQLSIHAIGDAGNRLVLDLIEEMSATELKNDHRTRIEHAQTISLDDIPRFKELGVIPSMQPTHCTSDMYWAEDRLGPDRIKGAYAWRKLVDTGVVIPGGSDSPVESLSPLWGIYAAVTRQDHDSYPEGGWYPEERMTIEEAVRMYTSWAAYASFEEKLKGSLEAGKLADFTLLSKDIFKEEPAALLQTKVLMTVVGGEIRYNDLLKSGEVMLAKGLK